VLGVNLDFCNVRTCHEDPVDAIERFRERIFLTHVKDSLFSTASGEYVPMGLGRMDYRPIIERLRAVGYDGYLSVECLYRGAKEDDPRGLVAHDLRILRGLLGADKRGLA
jgi:sugar phosphate isomerase/epimerase